MNAARETREKAGRRRGKSSFAGLKLSGLRIAAGRNSGVGNTPADRDKVVTG